MIQMDYILYSGYKKINLRCNIETEIIYLSKINDTYTEAEKKNKKNM